MLVGYPQLRIDRFEDGAVEYLLNHQLPKACPIFLIKLHRQHSKTELFSTTVMRLLLKRLRQGPVISARSQGFI